MSGLKQLQASLRQPHRGETSSYCSRPYCAPLPRISNPSSQKVHFYTVNLPTYDHLRMAVIYGSPDEQPNVRCANAKKALIPLAYLRRLIALYRRRRDVHFRGLGFFQGAPGKSAINRFETRSAATSRSYL
jgi:hypothetical protein